MHRGKETFPQADRAIVSIQEKNGGVCKGAGIQLAGECHTLLFLDVNSFSLRGTTAEALKEVPRSFCYFFLRPLPRPLPETGRGAIPLKAGKARSPS